MDAEITISPLAVPDAGNSYGTARELVRDRTAGWQVRIPAASKIDRKVRAGTHL